MGSRKFESSSNGVRFVHAAVAASLLFAACLASVGFGQERRGGAPRPLSTPAPAGARSEPIAPAGSAKLVGMSAPAADAGTAPPLFLAGRRAVEAKILAGLAAPLEGDLPPMTLRDLAAKLEKEFDAPVSVDWERVDAEGFDPEEKLPAIQGRGRPWKNAVEDALEPWKLRLRVFHTELRIVGAYDDHGMEAATFDVSDLLGPPGPWDERLLDVLREGCGTRSSWGDAGGQGQASILRLGGRATLVAWHSFHVRQEIAELLADLRGPGAELPPGVALRRKFEAKIEEALAKPLREDGGESTLGGLVEKLAARIPAPVRLELEPLSRVGMSGETPIYIQGRGQPLLDAVERSLRPVRLAPTIRNGGLILTSEAAAIGDEALVLRVYPVGDLLPAAPPATPQELDEQVFALVERVVFHESTWDGQADPGIVRSFRCGGRTLLLARLPVGSLREIEALLADLRTLARPSAAGTGSASAAAAKNVPTPAAK